MTSDARMPIGMSRLRVLRFLGGRRDRVEADVGEEDDAPRPRVTPGQAVRRMNGCQFAGFDEAQANRMKNSTTATLRTTITR